jgi:hypothetical protein
MTSEEVKWTLYRRLSLPTAAMVREPNAHVQLGFADCRPDHPLSSGSILHPGASNFHLVIVGINSTPIVLEKKVSLMAVHSSCDSRGRCSEDHQTMLR